MEDRGSQVEKGAGASRGCQSPGGVARHCHMTGKVAGRLKTGPTDAKNRKSLTKPGTLAAIANLPLQLRHPQLRQFGSGRIGFDVNPHRIEIGRFHQVADDLFGLLPRGDGRSPFVFRIDRAEDDPLDFW